MLLLIKFIFLLIHLFIISDCRIISNKYDFLNDIKDKKETFHIQNIFSVDDVNTIEIISSKFYLTGNSNDESELNLLNSRLIFKNECHTIEIKNITITGILEFENNKNVIFDHVRYNGSFLSNNKDGDLNPSLQIANSEFRLSEQYQGIEILNNNVDINNSTFFGNHHYNLFLMKVSGQKNVMNSTLNINDSLFSGNYHNGGIESSYTNITCTYTKFENFYSGRKLNR